MTSLTSVHEKSRADAALSQSQNALAEFFVTLELSQLGQEHIYRLHDLLDEVLAIAETCDELRLSIALRLFKFRSEMIIPKPNVIDSAAFSDLMMDFQRLQRVFVGRKS